MKFDTKFFVKLTISALAIFLGIHYWDKVLTLLGRVLSAASPLLVGAIIAYLVNILLVRYEAWFFPKSKTKIAEKSRRPVCMLLSYLTLIAVVVLVVSLVVPQLVACIRLILSLLPGAWNDSVAFLSEHNILSEDLAKSLSAIDWQSRIGQILKVVTTGLGNVVDVVVTTVSSLFSSLVSAIIGLIFSVYLLFSKETLARQFKKLGRRTLPPVFHRELRYGINVLNETFHKFIVGQCTEAVILGVLCTLGMLIFRLPYATMIGALVAFTSLIPIAGAYIGALVGAFMIMTVSPMSALGFLIFLVILQQIEGNIIYPKVVGTSIGLPGLWVLASITVGGGLAGITGMLLGVPLTAALYRVLRERLRKERS